MCGAVAGAAAAGGNMTGATVIEGTVARDGQPVAGAYVRLLDAAGEFVAEVPTSGTGSFRFFAAPGQWTVRTLAPGTPPVDRTVTLGAGAVAEVAVPLDA
jgi:hypothetical protein